MDFKQLVMRETSTVYQNMANMTTTAPLSKSVSVSESDAYSRKRDNYVQRLNRERSEYNSAVKAIAQARDERLRYERELNWERRKQREKMAASAKLLCYWFFVIIAISINLMFAVASMREAFVEVEKGGLGLPWKTLWPAWISTSLMLLLTAAFGRKAFKEPVNGVFVMILEVVTILTTAIVLSWSSNFLIGLIRCAVGYIVPVGVAGFIGMGIAGMEMDSTNN